ncbi:type II toxin-antitoxin system RelE/ParE family toxin [Longimicrobium sp.]|uniref:type II toxin-antitoxin system RelE/ParE family toxin n=1 Tax=Longimicrobium sp. TaxID=2029185 RepID=UPI002F94AFEE
MKHRLRFDEAARAEYISTLKFYRGDGSKLARAFAAEFRRVSLLLERHPMLGAPYYSGTRRKLLARFPYALIYLIDGSDVVVVALAHQRREPFYWVDRLNNGEER